jgi:hypothetical protein
VKAIPLALAGALTLGAVVALSLPSAAAGSALDIVGVTASGDDGNVSANTLDGDPSTRWSDQGDGVWIRYDLGSTQTVGSVSIAWYQGDTRAETFDIQVSDNGSEWTTVLDAKRTTGTTASAVAYDIADASGRYVRVVGHGNTYNDWTSIADTAILGADGSSDPGDPGDCAVPADVLDLTNWYEGLPIGDDEDPANVKQPELATYKIDPWFVATPNCDGVQFRAAVNGVTTSGSSYPRSELREMNGSDEASWSSTSGTHTMVIKEEITHLPNDKAEVVAGQIHGSDDDLTVFRLEGTKLYVTSGDTTHYKLITDDYQLGTQFEAKYVVSGGKVDAYYNGDLVATITEDFDGAYFKAGAYTQANCDKSAPCSDDNYGEVIIHSLSVTHS